MAFLLSKRLPHFLNNPTSQSRLTFLSLLRLCTEAPQANEPPFMGQYLVSSFGFSPDRALRCATSSLLSPIKTSARPEAVVHFLKETGFTDSEIKRVVTRYPQLLGRSVSKSLQSRVDQLMAAGFTAQTLIQLIQISPGTVLGLKYALPRLQFWRGYTGSDATLLMILRRSHMLLNLDIDKVMMPIIKVLKDYGFSDADVQKVWLSVGWVLKNVESTKKLLEETEALGFAPKSRKFLHALPVVGRCKRDTIMRKLAFMQNSYGWSEEEVQAAFKRSPSFVNLSENTLKSKMDFLLGCAGLTTQEISSKPEILLYSLERMLEPRNHVLSVLKLKGYSRNAALPSAVKMSEENLRSMSRHI